MKTPLTDTIFEDSVDRAPMDFSSCVSKQTSAGKTVVEKSTVKKFSDENIVIDVTSYPGITSAIAGIFNISLASVSVTGDFVNRNAKSATAQDQVERKSERGVYLVTTKTTKDISSSSNTISGSLTVSGSGNSISGDMIGFGNVSLTDTRFSTAPDITAFGSSTKNNVTEKTVTTESRVSVAEEKSMPSVVNQIQKNSSVRKIACGNNFSAVSSETGRPDNNTMTVQAASADEAKQIADQQIKDKQVSIFSCEKTLLDGSIGGYRNVTLKDVSFGIKGREDACLSIDSVNTDHAESLVLNSKTDDSGFAVLKYRYTSSDSTSSGGKKLTLENVSATANYTLSYGETATAEDLEVSEVTAGETYVVTLARWKSELEKKTEKSPEITASGFGKIIVEDSDLSSASGGTTSKKLVQSFTGSEKTQTGTYQKTLTERQKAAGTIISRESLSTVIGSLTGFKTVDLEFVSGLTNITGGDVSTDISEKSLVSIYGWNTQEEGAPYTPGRVLSGTETKTEKETASGSLNLFGCQVSGTISGYKTVSVAFERETWYHILDEPSYHLCADTVQTNAIASERIQTEDYPVFREWGILHDEKKTGNIYGGDKTTVTKTVTAADAQNPLETVKTITVKTTVTTVGSLTITNGSQIGADPAQEAISGFDSVEITGTDRVGGITGGKTVTETTTRNGVLQSSTGNLYARGTLRLSNVDEAGAIRNFNEVTLRRVGTVDSITVGSDHAEIKKWGTSLKICENYGGIYLDSGIISSGSEYLANSRAGWRQPLKSYAVSQPVTTITNGISGYRSIQVCANARAGTFSGTTLADTITVTGDNVGMAIFNKVDFGGGKDAIFLKKNGVFASDADFAMEKNGNNWNLEKISGTGTVLLKKGMGETFRQYFGLTEKSKISVIESDFFCGENTVANVWESAAEVTGETTLSGCSNWIGFCNESDFYLFDTKEIGSDLLVDVNIASQNAGAMTWQLQKYDSQYSSWEIISDKTAALSADSSYRIAVQSIRSGTLSLDYNGVDITFYQQTQSGSDLA